MKTFPYKTLIWAVVVVICLFLFKQPLMAMLSNTEEITILGNTLKVSKDESNALKESEQEYQGKINELNTMIGQQDSTIQVLTQQTNNLLADVQDCAQAKEAAKSVNSSLTHLNAANAQIKDRSAVIDRIKILSLAQKKQ